MKKVVSCAGLVGFTFWMAVTGCSSKSTSTGSLADGGGAGGATGTSTGAGTGTGTGTGTGGSGGGGDSCARACARLDGANCPADVPGECASSLCSFPRCIAQRDALSACVLAAPTIACDDDGNANPGGCDLQAAAYVLCILGDGGVP